MEPTDQEWLNRFITERDETAFAALVRRYEGLVRSVCRRVLRDHHLAEDAFQAVFLILAGQAPTLARRTGPLAGWLQTVATNAALQLRRSRLRARNRELVACRQPREAPLTELVGILDEELQQLDQPSRDAIVLCHLSGRTQDEAAAELGVSKSTLRRRIERGLGLLRSRFSKRGLFLPMFAVLWNALQSQPAEASPPNLVSRLADTAAQLARGRTVRPTALRLSHTSWNLSQGILTMTRWNRIRRWTIAGLLVGSLGAWELWSQGSWSEAADQVPSLPSRVAPGTETARDAKSLSTRDIPVEPAQPQAAKPLIARGAQSAKNSAPPQAAPPAAPKKDDLLSKLKAVKNKAEEKKEFPPVAPRQFRAQASSSSSFSGVMNINGKEIRTTDPAEFEKLMKQNGGLLPNFAPPGAGNKVFQGVINKNGVEQKFDDPDEFTEAAIEADIELPVLPGFDLP